MAAASPCSRSIVSPISAVHSPTSHRERWRNCNAALPPIWSRAKPVDIAGDADANRYAVAMDHLLEDDANDAVLVMNVPTALASAADAAKAVVAATERRRKQGLPPKPVFAVWVGGGEAPPNL